MISFFGLFRKIKIFSFFLLLLFFTTTYGEWTFSGEGGIHPSGFDFSQCKGEFKDKYFELQCLFGPSSYGDEGYSGCAEYVCTEEEFKHFKIISPIVCLLFLAILLGFIFLKNKTLKLTLGTIFLIGGIYFLYGLNNTGVQHSFRGVNIKNGLGIVIVLNILYLVYILFQLVRSTFKK